ncbi:MAG: hypothetical protein GX651_06055 [Methanomicrobiales archaeon]|nr:hypothetical protein [Methanomicrobiales archaeon]
MPGDDIDPLDRDYLAYNWGGLPWSEWVPFNADRQTFHEIPPEPGLFRIKPVGQDLLMYVGSTGRSLHTKLAGLRQALRRADLMPWADPHPEAMALWAWWVEWVAAAPATASDADGEELAPVMLECSATPVDASAAGRRGMESFLLYRYRQERGDSPLCNFGRFHPRYRKSTTRQEGRRGEKLLEGQKDNPAGWPCMDPLEAAGMPGSPDWMGLEWTAWEPLDAKRGTNVADGAGLYLLADAGTQEIVYIGQAADIKKRLLELAERSGDGRALVFSYQVVGQSVLPHNLRELAGDLLGNWFEQYRKVPELQFPSSKGR